MENMEVGDSIGKKDECEDFVIDIPLVLPPAEWLECCIYRIPNKLRRVNEEAYIPKLVSIGPFHHGRVELRNMEIQKLRYLKDFVYRVNKSQEDLLKIIKDDEHKIRRCYSEECKLSRKDFVRMILLDAIFIIELFLGHLDHEKENDYISSKPRMEIGIQDDLILLENQLPFFVLEKLGMFAFNDSSSCNHREEGKQIEEHIKDMEKQDAPFVKLSRHYFTYYDLKQGSIIGKEVKHFTDLLRYIFCSVPDLILKPREVLDYNLYSATDLDRAGLKFKPAIRETCLLDITFHRNKWLEYCPCFNLSWLLACLPCLKIFRCLERMQCILEVPPFEINNTTEGLFRNLMALEQCHYPRDAYICEYVLLLGSLINTEKDVSLLVDKNVIINKLGSNAAVAVLIDRLCIDIVVVGSCYSAMFQQINEYRNHPWNRIPVVFVNTYFNDFGRVNATLATLLALVGLFLPILTNNNGCKCN